MQEIIQSIISKTGLNEAQARLAFEAALSGIKTKMPESVANQLDDLLEGKDFNFSAVFNDKLNDIREDASKKLENIKDEAAETFEELKEEAAEKFENLKEGLKRMF